MDGQDIDVVVLLVANRRRQVSKQPERDLALYRSVIPDISEHGQLILNIVVPARHNKF